MFKGVGKTPWRGDQPYRKASTYTQHKLHKQKKRGETSMPRVGCEPTIPVFERTKIFHASDRAAILIRYQNTKRIIFSWKLIS
jgi:hypothetical protein